MCNNQNLSSTLWLRICALNLQSIALSLRKTRSDSLNVFLRTFEGSSTNQSRLLVRWSSSKFEKEASWCVLPYKSLFNCSRRGFNLSGGISVLEKIPERSYLTTYCTLGMCNKSISFHEPSAETNAILRVMRSTQQPYILTAWAGVPCTEAALGLSPGQRSFAGCPLFRVFHTKEQSPQPEEAGLTAEQSLPFTASQPVSLVQLNPRSHVCHSSPVMALRLVHHPPI